MALRPSLKQVRHPLADSRVQLEALAPWRELFTAAAAQTGGVHTTPVETLQLNLGKRCNQTCHHCHVDAGPDRREVMSNEVLDACIALLEQKRIPRLDLTGGAPELHPRFKDLVVRARGLSVHVMDRCNLTITQLPNYSDLPAFFAQNNVEVVASLPWYRSGQTDAQRGDGVFEQSIAAIRQLNKFGYGRVGSGLVLNLVSNPSGAFLPANQATMERDWRERLRKTHGIEFNQLFTLTNMPIARFLEFLQRSNQVQAYMDKLAGALNPSAFAGVMCKNTLSVGWDGTVYDCDFNQMLELAAGSILDPSFDPCAPRTVRVDAHCLGCVAGGGSSCGGATTS